MALALMGELISDHRRAKLKENQDADSITEVAGLKANGANKIRELYSDICEIPENPTEIELWKKQEIENERGSL